MINKKLSPRKLAERIKEIKSEMERIKPLYGELDELTDMLIGLDLNLSKYGIAIQDNFESKNTAWKSTAMRRFELVVVPEQFVPVPTTPKALIHKKKEGSKQGIFTIRRSR